MAEEFGKQSEPTFLRRAREAMGSDRGSSEPAPAERTSRAADDATQASAASVGGAGSALSRSVAAAGERIQGILDAAEEVAAGIRSDAEAEAEDYLRTQREAADEIAREQAGRLEAVLESVRAEARAMKRQADSMVSAVEAALEEARRPAPTPVSATDKEAEAAPDANGPAPADPGEVSRAPRAHAFAYPGTRPQPAVDADESEDREGALIRATQMAVRGVDRAGIEEALRSEFGLTDPAPIVNEILGAG